MGAKSWVLNKRTTTAKGVKTRINNSLCRALGMWELQGRQDGGESNLGMAMLASLRSRHLDDLTRPAFEHHKAILT